MKLIYLPLVLFMISAFFMILLYSHISDLDRQTHANYRFLGKVKLDQPNSNHKLCIIVPFRDRFDELVTFVPEIHKFLSNQSIDHEIFIVNQIDTYRFNRASLINVGYFEALGVGCDYLAMHDVDLIPLNAELSYR